MTETELLFTEILNCSRLSLYLDKDKSLNKAKSSLIADALKKRIKAEPLQYILGKTEFMGLEFKVTPDVFIPRPETEVLVEKALEVVTRPTLWRGCPESQVTSLKIMDIGTGSGNIAISLAKLLSIAKITAIDISCLALEVARQNAILNKVDNRIKFLQGDLLMTCDLQLKTYDIIVTNPPYIPSAEIETLQPEIQHEPHIALDGGRDGLDFYRRITNEAPAYLKAGGFLVMEIGFGQAEAIRNIFQKSAVFEIIEVVKDYNNIDRVIVAKNIKGY